MDRLVSYIEQNRDTYTREAIDWQLQGAGYQPQQIAAAWAMIEGGAAPIPEVPIPPPPASKPTPSADYDELQREAWGPDFYSRQRPRSFFVTPVFWLVLVGFIVLSYALPAMLSAIFANTDVSFIMFAALQICAVVTGLFLLGQNRPPAMGLLMGVLAVVVIIPCVTFAILFGTCLVMLNSSL